MKLLFALVTLLFLGSCATKVPYTKEIKKEFNLTPDKLKGVQFYTSEAIILEREGEKQNISTTGEDGELVSSESSSSTRIIIPANRVEEEIGRAHV